MIYFMISLLLGFFVVYVMSPEPVVILKQPNPNTAHEITYVDDNNVCYRYDVEEVQCTGLGDVHLYE